MADGFLESHYAEYERKKEAYLNKKKHAKPTRTRHIERPDDEAL